MVEKIVEVERIVEVEKIVYVNVDGTIADGNQNAVAPTGSDANGLVNSIERSVSQFVDHQQQLLNVHEQYMQGPKDYAKTFDDSSYHARSRRVTRKCRSHSRYVS